MKRVERAQGEIPDDLPDAVFNERRGRSISMVTRIPISSSEERPLPPPVADIIETDFQPRMRSVTFATYDDKPKVVPVTEAVMKRRSSDSLSNLSRPRAFSNYRRVILLAVDSSDNSKWAFNWFLEQIYRLDDLIVVTHCPEYVGTSLFSTKTKFFTPTHSWQNNLEEANKKLRELEKDFEALCVQKKLKYHTRFETFTSPGEGILKVADEEGADMIVIGSRGLSGVKRAFMSSVSDYVLRNAKVPVVVVPARSRRDPSFMTP